MGRDAPRAGSGHARRRRRDGRRPPARTAALLAALALPAAGALCGCSSAEAPDVQRVAALFEDPGVPAEQRCAVLAPAALAALEHQEGQACTAVLPGLPLAGGPVRSSEVWGDDAQVRLSADTVFLARGQQGWVVTGAGCRSQGDAPYLCSVSTP